MPPRPRIGVCSAISGTRQGEAAAWPDWEENPTGQSVRGLLAKVEIDPLIDALRGRMWSAYLENFTPTGQGKAGGLLRTAEEELAGVDKALADLNETRPPVPRRRGSLRPPRRRTAPARSGIRRLP